ncbi:phage tail protein [Paenibacillus nicotianae]|uniref:Phage tail protein n=1 Tax=Paenibacillus nicotianae TaxID=1526551 RepID=A0ABW4UWE8_9BACL
MADPFTGEIRMFAGNFAPQDWLFCQGQEVSILAYQALYSIIGNNYGVSSSQNTFKLPNLQGNVPMHQGTGANPTLTPRAIGSTVGTETVTLSTLQMPIHNHIPQAKAIPGNTTSPSNALWSQSPKVGPSQSQINLYGVPNSTVPMDPLMVQYAGGGQPHNNMQPFLALNFIICCIGEYPLKP